MKKGWSRAELRLCSSYPERAPEPLDMAAGRGDGADRRREGALRALHEAAVARVRWAAGRGMPNRHEL